MRNRVTKMLHRAKRPEGGGTFGTGAGQKGSLTVPVEFAGLRLRGQDRPVSTAAQELADGDGGGGAFADG